MHRHRPFVEPASMKLLAVLGIVGLLLLGIAVPRADAGIGGSDTPTWPATALVGSTFAANVLIVNTSTSPNNTENVRLTSLFVTPACASGSAPICLAGNQDPGVFSILSAVGDASTTPCNGITFTVGVPDASTGEVQLVPTSSITLGPSNAADAAKSCRVNMSIRVNHLPNNPVPGHPGTTDPLSRATLLGVSSDLDGSASGAAQITITETPPPPPPPPPPQIPPCGLPGSPSCIPTLSEWVMIMLAGFIVLVGALAVRRKRSA